ncbi:MAG: MMPL family transporter [Deltaproteobacteria bacterium]|nr:MMPL family transporter [Deltaproteobacteria bacterium]
MIPVLNPQRLSVWSTERPRATIAIVVLIAVLFAVWLPKVRTDTDPKNMLPPTSDVRVLNDKVEQWFGLHKDMIVVGLVREGGIFDTGALKAVERVTRAVVDLAGVVSADVISLTTADNVVVEEGTLRVEPLLSTIPETPDQMERFRAALLGNTMVVGRLVSQDGTATAIYVPLEKGANGKEIADKIREIVRRGDTGGIRYFVAGDPVARDTFGVEMFRQMAVFAPLAGMVMLIALYLMFRSLILSFSIMAVAMAASIWSMGLLVAVGQPVHIMSSMMPVFLMAIATDSIHIFNEFYFRLREAKDRRNAVLETMRVVGAPVSYTALATAAGFGALVLGEIIPVRVFGIFVAFGTMAIRLMSFSLIPAVMMLVPERVLLAARDREDPEAGASRWLGSLGRPSIGRPRLVLAAGALLLVVAAAGIPQIRINNNMIRWFRQSSELAVADRVMNAKLAGTSLLYIVASSDEPGALKDPLRLRYLEALQRKIERVEQVGKATSVVDLVKRINRVLQKDRPEDEILPGSRDVIGQYLFLFGMSAKPSTLENLLDGEARRANIWVQLKSWDAEAVERVLGAVKSFTSVSPPPGLTIQPSGIAYFNLVWNDEVLKDMVKTFIAALIVVLAILAISFRSLGWGMLSFVPLLFTISLIYGVVGLLGKDFDMPISVLSTLSLGMAVDFAIHFIRRYRQRLEEHGGTTADALVWTVSRPGKGILRNAVLFSLAFAVMLASSLTPYVTVGVFIIAMMMLSAIFTLVYLPALVMLLARRSSEGKPAGAGQS